MNHSCIIFSQSLSLQLTRASTSISSTSHTLTLFTHSLSLLLLSHSFCRVVQSWARQQEERQAAAAAAAGGAIRGRFGRAGAAATGGSASAAAAITAAALAAGGRDSSSSAALRVMGGLTARGEGCLWCERCLPGVETPICLWLLSGCEQSLHHSHLYCCKGQYPASVLS